MKNKRLSKDDWIAAGFHALIDHGPAALKAEALARTLDTTKGSFYWHFKDVPAFHTHMLTHWEQQALNGLVAEIETKDTAVATLQRFVQSSKGNTNSAAVRAWARTDSSVAKAVAHIDKARLKYLTTLLKRCGVGNPDLACALYAAMVGIETLPDNDETLGKNALTSLVDLILALR
jgi:AcrR family transcriptional regulator